MQIKIVGLLDCSDTLKVRVKQSYGLTFASIGQFR